ncbi:hypothetical protein B8W72_18130 [Pseudomonas putida]|uniref:Uncharacterized protein n=1 Tax=Pseudomonas putida TaxID=303 RepID=A0A1Y3KVY2_PSEPU|nr:hypothetical protein B8W72_18130 [Pseudomonas putida]
MSRKGRKAAPAMCAPMLKSRGRSAALSRHKAAPTFSRVVQQKRGMPSLACPVLIQLMRLRRL